MKNPLLLIVAGLLCLVLVPVRVSPQGQAKAPVRPAKVEPMQNLETGAAHSGFPVYIPREWGRLVSVQKIDAMRYLLFLQAENGEIYLVRLIQRGEYLYLDTYDQGGIALVIKRDPQAGAEGYSR